MSTQATTIKAPVAGANEVRLVGRVSGEASSLVLPSGDELVTFRISVTRPDVGTPARQKVDSVPCCTWTSRVRRSAMTWRTDDVVEVSGAVRCRFFQTGRGVGSRVEVEVTSARLIRRAPAA
ncbi:MAG: single-stranded DNA-binding protein [Nocardioides sp.]|nr:single-stranded DNA-binding protein [Nocardioides sp.]